MSLTHDFRSWINGDKHTIISARINVDRNGQHVYSFSHTADFLSVESEKRTFILSTGNDVDIYTGSDYRTYLMVTGNGPLNVTIGGNPIAMTGVLCLKPQGNTINIANSSGSAVTFDVFTCKEIE